MMGRHTLAYGRSIPAWAGETRGKAWPAWKAAVYPRVGGGNPSLPAGEERPRGLSPRGRGKPNSCATWPPPMRSIPAWAGETSAAWPNCRCCMVYPRVGGGNGLLGPFPAGVVGLSPRGRGKPYGTTIQTYPLRSIPAWAGETQSRSTAFRLMQVYPRVGGGNGGGQSKSPRGPGLSPRGRGKPAPKPGCG